MAFITLISDYGSKEYYICTYKAEIMTAFEDVKVIDISHDIEPYQVAESVYNCIGAMKRMQGEVYHYVFVEAEIEDYDFFVVLKKGTQWIMTANNGWASLASFFVDFDEIYRVSTENYQKALDLYIDVTKKIKLGTAFEEVLAPLTIEEIVSRSYREPILSDDGGSVLNIDVVYEDSFGNLVTNVSRKTFEEMRRGRAVEFRVGKEKVKTIHNHFSDFQNPESRHLGVEADVLVMFNDMDLLQVSVYKSNRNCGTVDSLFAVKEKNAISIVFKEH